MNNTSAISWRPVLVVEDTINHFSSVYTYFIRLIQKKIARRNFLNFQHNLLKHVRYWLGLHCNLQIFTSCSVQWRLVQMQSLGRIYKTKNAYSLMLMLVIIHRAFALNYFLASFMVSCRTNPAYVLLTLSSNAILLISIKYVHITNVFF